MKEEGFNGKEIGMLVLSRYMEESIRVGDVKVTVIDIRGDRVRLGIEAPPEVAVHREEVYERVRSQNTGERIQETEYRRQNTGDRSKKSA